MKRREYIQNFMESGANRKHARQLYRAYRRAGVEPVEETVELPRNMEGVARIGTPVSMLAGAVSNYSEPGLVRRSIAVRPDYDSMNFKQAFRAAVNAGAKIFTWRGKQYTTKQDPYYRTVWYSDKVLNEPTVEEPVVVVPGDEAFLNPMNDYTPQNTVGMFTIDKDLAQGRIDAEIEDAGAIPTIEMESIPETAIAAVPMQRVPTTGTYDVFTNGPGVAYTSDPNSVPVDYAYRWGGYRRPLYKQGGLIPQWMKTMIK